MRRTAAILAGIAITAVVTAGTAPAAAAATTHTSTGAATGAATDLAATGAAFARAHGMDTVWRQTVQASLAGRTTVCGPTALNRYVDRKLAGADPKALATLSKYDGLDVPFIEALLEKDGTPQRLGYRGTLTRTLKRELSVLDRFWDAPTSRPGLFGVHGDVLASVSRTARVYRLGYGLSAKQALVAARHVVPAARSLPHGGVQNPVVTLNAFSQDDEDGITNRIVYGDGIGGFFQNVYFNQDHVAVQYVLAHEFGHQVQYALDIPTDESTAKKSRKVEMMADAYGAYFMANKKGENATASERAVVARSAFVVGDCALTEAGHHGTPTERAAAARWAADLYRHQKDPARIIDPRVLERKFLKALPRLIATDGGGGPAYT